MGSLLVSPGIPPQIPNIFSAYLLSATPHPSIRFPAGLEPPPSAILCVPSLSETVVVMAILFGLFRSISPKLFLEFDFAAMVSLLPSFHRLCLSQS